MWREDVEKIKGLSHRLSNILVIAGSGMNRVKNANSDTVGKRWGAMIDAIIVTERKRISKEIELYIKEREIIGRVSGETYADIYRQLLNVDKYYKIMFDILDNSKEYSEKDKNTAFINGDKMVKFLKDIINKLEAVKIELQKE